MRGRGWWAGLVLAVGVAGCSEVSVCQGTCPDVAGTFAVDLSNPTGVACDYSPYLFGPQVVLTQSGNGQVVSTSLVDPVNQLPVPLSGNVLEPDDSGLGRFVMHGQVSRQSSRADPALITVSVDLAGAVDRSNEPGQLNATLTMVKVQGDGAAGCAMVFQVVGQQVTGTGG